MSIHKAFSIGVLGLSVDEIKVLGSIATLTQSRPNFSYTVNPATDASGSDIVIVNADDQDAAIKWRALAVLPHPPVMILYTKVPSADPVQHYLLRPFGPSRLLALLDRIAVELKESAQIWKKPAPMQPAAALAVDTTQVPLRALVVDDSPTVRKLIELELRNFNVLVDTEETGEAALNRLSGSHYDLIFLDLVLPGTDGYQVCKEIRRNPKTKQTPVIMLTSKSSRFDRVRGSLVGCNEYLTKPVDYPKNPVTDTFLRRIKW
jgi:two-component system cell cycle response regulator